MQCQGGSEAFRIVPLAGSGLPARQHLCAFFFRQVEPVCDSDSDMFHLPIVAVCNDLKDRKHASLKIRDWHGPTLCI